MAVLQTTTSGDLDFGARKLIVVKDGVDACVMTLRKAFSLWQGSWFLDQSVGMPWLQQILGQKPTDLDAIASLFRRRCLAYPGATSADVTCTYDGSTRGLSVVFVVQLDDGSTAEGSV